ncbi:alpha-protein kinase 3-like [Neosynchiropus ocellatus]
MDSRRTSRTSFGNGRSSSGESSNGGSRPVSCSYLTNVRPENRSTLCSVIAQLTEETQPLFEKTLRSRAVCADCNVKFSCTVTGHPVPQVTWYKDDMQLDRYCGLPKYEIFRNGQNHSLHIYNCTLDDAAIYQASASNTKGIVSCSGVLEVGEMNEFKIHQRYFAKLKQKAESKRREAEGKENQEPIRTISPDRTQRKRRSNMEAFLSTPSSTEDEGMEDACPRAAAEPQARLQEPAVEQTDEKPATSSGGGANNRQVVTENGVTNGAVEASQASAVHQPKAPFVKKKIKISNSIKGAKEEVVEEKVSEDKREGTSILTPNRETGEERMEVERSRTAFNPDSRRRPVRKKWEDGDQKSKVENVSSKPLKKEPLSTSMTPSPPPRLSKVKQISKMHKESKVDEAQVKIPKQSHSNPQIHLKAPSVLSKVVKVVDATVMDVDQKPAEMTAEANLKTPSAPFKRQTVVAGEPTPGQLVEKETGSVQKKLRECHPALPNEVTPVGTKMKQDVPPAVKLFDDQCSQDVRAPRKSPADRGSIAADVQTPSVKDDPAAAVIQVTRDTQARSKGSSGGQTLLFTDPEKSPVKSLSGDDNTEGSRVASLDPRSQVDTAIKSVEETEMQVEEKAAVNEQGGLSVSGDQKSMDETETRTPSEIEIQSESQNNEVTVVGTNAAENTAAVEVQDEMEHEPPKTLQPPQTSVETFQEVQIPVTSVISIAELLRSQIKALGLSLGNGFAPDSERSSAADRSSQDRGKSENMSSEGTSGSVSEKQPDADKPPKNLTETLMEIYRLLNQSANEMQGSVTEISPQKPPPTPPICVVDTSAAEPDVKGSTEGFMDVGQESSQSADASAAAGASELAPKHVTPVLPEEEVQVTSSSNQQEAVQEGSKTDAEESIPGSNAEDRVLAAEHHSEAELKNEEKGSRNCPEELKAPDSSVERLSSQNGLVIKGDDPQLTPQENLAVEPPHQNPDASPLLKKRHCPSPIPSATPEELASGARRKIFTPKSKSEESSDVASATHEESAPLSASPATLATSPTALRRSRLLQPSEERPSAPEKRSPQVSRRKVGPETQSQKEETKTQKPEEKPAEKDKTDPRKAPQVIRKIRGENFADSSGHLKLWCQFFNILSDSLITWYRNQVEIAQIKRTAADESPVNLAIVQASGKDSGVYKCTITNEFGTDSTDFLLNAELMAGGSLRDEAGGEKRPVAFTPSLDDLCSSCQVGEEIEMTPLLFSKGVADTGSWGNKFFGRILVPRARVGDGPAHKAWRAKVIYGLEPVFESGNTCIIKTRSPIAYGGKEESCLLERNLEFVKKECRIQNLAREYCKIFAAETRVAENFGPSFEVIPLYLIYRPANTIPYATVEADLAGVFKSYTSLDATGQLEMRGGSELELKCCTLQHWIYQWTHGNLLLTQMEGVDTRITNIEITAKSSGHQGLPVEGNPKLLEQFVSQHQCNYFCGLLGLRSLKVLDSLMTPQKPRGSKSPLLQRKLGAGSSSPQAGRKVAGSPKPPRKAEDQSKTKQSAS